MGFDSSLYDRRDAYEAAKAIGNFLNLYFGKEQGVVLGESCVVSLKAHGVGSGLKGYMKILINRDAGQHFLEFIEPGMVVNLNICHKKAVIDPRETALKIWAALEEYAVMDVPRLSATDDERQDWVTGFAMKVHVTTRGGKGTVYDLIYNNIDPIELEDAGINYVRVLCKFDSDRYGLILPIAQAVEEAIMQQGVELGKVKSISHNKAKEPKKGGGSSITLPWRKFKNASYEVMKENQSQITRKMAEKFGSVEELEDFLDSHTTNVFKRMNQFDQKRKWGDLNENIQDFKDAGLMKDSILGPVLTRDGKEMKEFIIKNKCELEAEMRRNIRHAPGTGGRYRTMGSNSRKMASIEFTNRNKTLRLSNSQWGGDLAVPETILNAKKKAMIKNAPMTIKKEDLYVYGKRSYVPLDMCILIDASASMSGEKRQAACFLAEHLLLTGREKVAVVTFQEQKARVVVPFTKNQKELSYGLTKIIPGGMTPLASGLMTSIEHIKSSRVHNPTLILITDGIPNYPLWSFDAEKDAMEAAQKIPENKIRLLCIGVESNRDFLEQLVEKAQGRLFVVDDLDRTSLINIVRTEKRLANLEARG